MLSNVKELRESVGLKQADLAREIGVCRKTINLIEKDSCNPSLDLAYRVAQYFNKAVEEVFIHK
ncbi:MAG: helix-turn-helix transcriptional regulator [Lachnospiraceae bacterium]|nr:helix-turn-helix transcriptional regulator [Lachnospiraceae bacterium]